MSRESRLNAARLREERVKPSGLQAPQVARRQLRAEEIEAIKPIMSIFERDVAPLFQEYAWRFANLKELIGRFDELAQDHKGRRKDAFTNRLKIISADLGAALTSYRNVVEQIAGIGVEVSEAGTWARTALIVQDHIAAYLRGEIVAEGLASVYMTLPGNIEHSVYLRTLKWGKKTANAGRLYVGRCLYDQRQADPSTDIGEAVLKLKTGLKELNTRTEEESKANEWLGGYEGKRLAKRAYDAIEDYEKHQFSAFGAKSGLLDHPC